jgi:transcriptional regulator with XRE-family HTH domain
MNYGRALKIARALSDLEQQELASLAGLDSSHVSLIEQGKRNPTITTLEKIAKGLGVPYHLLTVLAAEPKDLKNVRASEIRELGELLARLLLTNKHVDKPGRSKSRPRRRAKA